MEESDMSKSLEMKADPLGQQNTSEGAAITTNDGGSNVDAPLFEEYYDDWGSFDQAVANAIEKHHPIRKRSSLTFEVYNRTVSKGRHDRKNIADYLSKTFKCTHGIKFRSRGNGKRLRHKLRDIGCPFHVYASAVEYGATYRVKVRMHDKHNHPIGPDSMKNMTALQDSDYELNHDDAEASAAIANVVAESNVSLTEESHAQSQSTHVNTHSVSQNSSYEQVQAHAQTQAAAIAQAQAVAHAQAHAHAQAIFKAQLQIQQTQLAQAQAEALLKAQEQAQSQAQALLDAQHNHATDILDASVHESEVLLDGAIEGSIGDDFASTTSSNSLQTAKFEETMTLEGLRKRIAEFADERDWNQFHTPRNLLLALTGELGELCELFQWKGECKNVDDWTPEEKTHLGEELSDVMIYLIRLADKCDVDFPAVINDKIIKNGIKYPAKLVKGSSKKYNEYKRMRLDKSSI